MRSVSGWILVGLTAGLSLGAAPGLWEAPGPVDALATDRGWESSDPVRAAPPRRDDAVALEPGLPEALAAGLQAAKAHEQIENQPRRLCLDVENGHLRIDNAGDGVRYLGTSAVKPFKGDFVVEFELTSVLAGATPAAFGLSDKRHGIYSAPHALFIEYGTFKGRKPVLRWMAVTPQKGLQELGRFPELGPVADKLVRLTRRGTGLRLTIQQDYLVEGTLEAQVPEIGVFTWVGAEFTGRVAERGQRTILTVDNIRGLDSDQPREDARAVNPCFEFRGLGGAWPPKLRVGGLDVTSPEYAWHAGLPRPLRFEEADLSDGAGWPRTTVRPGTVAFDPKTRRVRFSDGVDREIRRVGHIDLPRGTPRRVVLNNGFAYVAHGAGSPSSHIVIVDVRRPDQPQVVSTLGLDWQPADLEVRAGVAYVPDGIGLHVVDVKDPAAPRVIAHYTQELGPRHGEARCVAIQNHILYLASAYRGVDALDVSDPAAPKLVGSWSSPGLASPTDLLVRGSCLWLASSEGIQILDVSKPSQPKAVQESRPARPKSSTEDGLLDAEDGGDAPAKGVTLKAYREIRNALRLALEEEYLYVVDKNRGLLILDISDPFSPDAVGRYEPKAGKEVKGREVHATSVIVNQQTAYLTVNCGQIPQMLDGEEKPVPVDAGGGLHILNAGDPLEPFLMGRWLPAGTMVDLIDVAIQGSVAVVADASYGLWTVDVSDPRQPSKLGEAPTQGDVRDLAMEGRMAYLASGGGQGILAVDLANPERPQIIGRYHTGFDAPSLAVKEGVVYTGSPDWSLPIGLQVIDFRDPARPERREVLSASAASQWSEHEGLLYASSGEVFDLTDPFRPMAYGKLPAGALYRSGPVFCVASPNMLYGLSIIDTSQDLREKGPARLRLFLDSSGRTGIIRRGDVLFLTGGPQGVAVVSLRNPESPQLLKMLRGNLGAATDVCVWGTALGIVDAYAGLQIYDAVDPARPRLRAVYPARGDNVSPSGSRCIAKDGLLFRTRGNGIDILEPPIPSEAPLGEVRPGAP